MMASRAEPKREQPSSRHRYGGKPRILLPTKSRKTPSMVLRCEDRNEIQRFGTLLLGKKNIVIVSGAGISTNAGGRTTQTGSKRAVLISSLQLTITAKPLELRLLVAGFSIHLRIPQWIPLIGFIPHCLEFLNLLDRRKQPPSKTLWSDLRDAVVFGTTTPRISIAAAL